MRSPFWPRDVYWPYPYSPVEHDEREAFDVELQKELKPGHALFGLRVTAIARRADSDDVLFEIMDGSGRFADVHLTWAGDREKPPWPMTSTFAGFAEWVEAVMKELGS